MASALIPGHFMLPLPINKDINIDKVVVETKIRVLGHFKRVRVDRPEELAILNLQGILTIRLRRYQDALVYFHQVLNKDPENLNALANLQYVLEKLFRLSEAEECKGEWTRLIRSPTEDPVVLKKRNSLRARCLAEHAYAYAFDVHGDTVGAHRYKQSNQLYDEALRDAGDDVDSTEYEDWIFNKAIISHTLFDRLWYENDPTAAEYIDDAVKWFLEIIKRSPGDPEIQWDSWRHLADIFRAMTIRKIKRAVPLELETFRKDPEKCMLEAMKITPKNARLLARYGNFLYSLKKETQRPLELLEQSISLDSSEFNFYAFTTRAMISLKFYKYQWKRISEEKHDSGELALLRNTLQVAKSDLEKAMSMHVTPWDLAKLGEVYYLLARNHTQDDTERRNLIEKALLQLTRAADCQDGYKQQALHSIRGRCLFDIGEKRSAIGCFKQAIDCEPSNTTYTGNFNELLGVYLNILQDKDLEDLAVIAETAFSLKEAVAKYGKVSMGRYCIGKLRQYHDKELRLIEIYCQKHEEYHEVVALLQASVPTPQASQTAAIVRKESKLHQSWVTTLPSSRPWGVKKAGTSDAVVGAAAATAITAAAGDGVAVGQERSPRGDDDADVTEDDAVDATEDRGVSSLASKLNRMSFQEQQQPIRKAPKEARVEQFENDFCVIYPKNQTGWVSYDLLNELEGVRKLKGEIHDRDSVPGEPTVSSKIDRMKRSASILLVIDQNFRKECELEMFYALQRREERENSRFIIPILRDQSKVPVEVNIFNTFEAIGAVDWDRLALVIEQQP